jgi:hypothetical protein
MKTLKQFLSEAKHPIFKGLALPGGEKAEHNHIEGTYSWHKHGGYADKVKAKLNASLPKAGWKKVESTQHGSPDGSVMGHGHHYRKGDHILKSGSSFGSVKYDNFHQISIEKVPTKVTPSFTLGNQVK